MRFGPAALKENSLITTLSELAQIAAFGFFAPYLGAAVVGADLIEGGYSGDVQIIDYRDLDRENNLDQILGNGRYSKIGWMTGVLSPDIMPLQLRVNVLRNRGIRPVLGGLGPTIDPWAFALSTRADVFIGEAEGAMALVLEILGNALDSDQFIFHRGLPDSNKIDRKYVIARDDIHHQIIHVYLNLPPRVHLDEYYAPEKEARRLAVRMRLEEDMREPWELGGKKYDPWSQMPTQLSWSVFCPSACAFCSTPRAHGRAPRRIPAESVGMRLLVDESPFHVLVDQNWGAIGSSEGEESWAKEMSLYFGLLAKMNHRVFFQTDPSFFDRLPRYPKLAELVGKTTSAVLIGIEQPKKVRGARHKDPDHLPAQLAVARELGIPVLGTLVINLPRVLSAGGQDTKSEHNLYRAQELLRFIEKLGVQAIWAFPFVRFPGAVAVAPTPPEAENPLAFYHQGLVAKTDSGGDPWEEVDRILEKYYSFLQIFRRLVKVIGYRKGRVAFTLLVNCLYPLIVSSGSSVKEVSRRVR